MSNYTTSPDGGTTASYAYNSTITLTNKNGEKNTRPAYLYNIAAVSTWDVETPIPVRRYNVHTVGLNQSSWLHTGRETFAHLLAMHMDYVCSEYTSPTKHMSENDLLRSLTAIAQMELYKVTHPEVFQAYALILDKEIPSEARQTYRAAVDFYTANYNHAQVLTQYSDWFNGQLSATLEQITHEPYAHYVLDLHFACIYQKENRFNDRIPNGGNPKPVVINSKADYQNYLQSDHWKQTRKAALERSHHRCQICNSPERLQVHHRTYDRLGAELPEDLTVLCANCHHLFHNKGGLVR